MADLTDPQVTLSTADRAAIGRALVNHATLCCAGADGLIEQGYAHSPFTLHLHRLRADDLRRLAALAGVDAPAAAIAACEAAAALPLARGTEDGFEVEPGSDEDVRQRSAGDREHQADAEASEGLA